MSENVHQREILVEKRARALAMMLLTRRADLLIEEVKDDIGLDYIVRFHTEGKEGLREFGIALRGAWATVTRDHANKVLRPAVQHLKRYGPFLRPVCLFFFTMENDGAWYTWVAEPIESEDGKPLLRSGDEPDCRQLDKKGIERDYRMRGLVVRRHFPQPHGERTRREQDESQGSEAVKKGANSWRLGQIGICRGGHVRRLQSDRENPVRREG
jgi:hypothetical protein